MNNPDWRWAASAPERVHNGMVHAVAALLLTAVVSTGLAGLGELLGARSVGDRWVRGWTLVWWLVAVTAQFVNPRIAVTLGLLAIAIGSVWAGLTLRRRAMRPTIAFTVALLAGSALWLLPPYFYDALVYHLGLPWSWLINGTFSTIPHNVFSHFPLAGPTVYLLPVELGVPEAAAGLHWMTFVVVLVALARVAGNLGAGRWRWLAPALLVGCWHAVWIASVAAVDHLMVLGVVVGVQHLTETRGEEGPDRVGLGTAWGLALATKYPAAVPVAALAVAAFAMARGRRLAVVAGGSLAVVLSSFWWLRNLVVTGNPIFPLLWSVFGGAGWSLRDDQRFQALVREGVQGGDLSTGLTHLIVPPDGLGWWFLLALPLVIAAVLHRDERAPRVRVVAVAGLLAVAGWFVSSQTTRYALPLAALVAALAATGIAHLSRRTVRVVATGLALGIAYGLVSLTAFLVGTLGLDRLWRGEISAEAWRRDVTVNDPRPVYRACDRLVPEGARVLVVGEGRSWGCPRPHHVSSPYDLQLVQEVVEHSDDANDVAMRLRRAGWSYLVINWAEVSRLGGPNYRVLRFADPHVAARWRAFLGACSSTVWHGGGSEIRRLQVLCTPFHPPDGGASR
jgi:hypothetical protein